VDICDEHAEDASIKSAKAAYQEKQDKIKILLEQAKLLGLNISETNNGLVVFEKPTTTNEPEPEPETPNKKAPAQKMEDGFISTDMIDRHRPIITQGGNTSLGNIASHSSYDITETRAELPENALKGKVKMAVVEGRGGQPLAVPQQRIDGTGTTRINIIKSENDSKLQERFKKMAKSSLGDQSPDFARSGYSNSTANCPVCRGDGTVNMGKTTQSCPKCGGSGIISTY
jgi:hypothetical protein